MWVSSTINVLLSNTETQTHTNREERIHLVSTKAIGSLWQRQPAQTLLFQQGKGDRPVAVIQAVVAKPGYHGDRPLVETNIRFNPLGAKRAF